MNSYLFIGGGKDGLTVLMPEDRDTVQMPLGATVIETYIHDTLTVGDTSITIYRHGSLTPQQVLNRFVEYYKAWAVNRNCNDQ